MIHQEDKQDEPGEEKGIEEPEFVKGLEVEPNQRDEEYRPDGKYKGDDPREWERRKHPEEEDPEARRLRIERQRGPYINPEPPKHPEF